MKTVYQFFLVIFFTLSFFVFFITSTVKFGLLNYNFLSGLFNKHNIYTNLAVSLKGTIESQIDKSGGKIKDIAVLTDLITTENTKEFVNKNLYNILKFINGNDKKIYVYIPIDKVPSQILPKNLTGIETQMTLGDFGTKFNVEGLDNIPVEIFSDFGLYDYYVLMFSTMFMGVMLILIFLSVDAGKKFIAPGIALMIAGVVTFLSVLSAANMNGYIQNNFYDSTSLNKIIAREMIRPIAGEIMHIWLWLGIFLIILGILCLLIRRKGAYKIG